MRRLISPEVMLETEKQYFEQSGIPSSILMEYAARLLTDAVLENYPSAQVIYIACGPGGNGGDGYACARKLMNARKSCRVIAPVPPKSPDTILNRSRILDMDIPIHESADGLPAPDLWIDCLYGTGLSRAPENGSAALIERMNADPVPVVSADIPSGLNGKTGRAYTPCVRADLTVAFQLAKFGHMLQDGLDMCGTLLTADIGFPDEIFTDTIQLFQAEDICSVMTPRKRNIHKGKCGHLLIVAGSFGMAGAAALCAKAALRSGVGLVTIACPEEIVPILQILAPQAMCLPLPDGDASSALQTALAGKTAIAVGPGLGRRFPAKLLRLMLRSGLPTVVDADALNVLAEHQELIPLLKSHHILTPHPGEASRLLERPCQDPLTDAGELAQSGATIVLKGASRVICGEGETIISASGGSGMARGGSGDVFTGILGALLADPAGRPGVQTAAAACEIHGLAGELAQEKYGSYAMNSADLIEALPEVFKRYAERR